MTNAIQRLVDFFRDQKVLILGFGREGQSTYRFLRQFLPKQKLYLADQNAELLTQFPQLQNDTELICFLGEQYLDHLEEFDIIMKSPGISFKDLDVTEFVDKIQSQLELVLRFCDIRSIGVTGTKGKSTTSSLIYQVLQDQNLPSLLLGNIGEPAFEHLDAMQPGTTVVFEMSSHQLEFMHHSPQLALLLNLHEEHLDHYRSFDDYAEAKCNIFRFQTQQDFLLYNADDATLCGFVDQVASLGQRFQVSFSHQVGSNIYLHDQKVYFGDQVIYDATVLRKLPGDYNLSNTMFVMGVAKLLDLDLQQAARSVNQFQGLPHRLEMIGEVNGVKYYDNSIATIPAATIAAVQALGDVDTLIIGGMDRGIDYRELVQFLDQSNIAHIICMPDTGYMIASQLSADKVVLAATLEDAVSAAKKLTAAGKSCLLSPAAASYGFFKNFEEKGNLFKELVLKY